MIRNIIFDWSGTLVNDLPAVWTATNYVLRQARRAELTLDEFRAAFCLPFTRFYMRHVPHVPLPQLEVWFHRRYRQLRGSVCALPHARRFLMFCRARHIRAFLLSAVHRNHFAAQCCATGFDGFFESVYIGVRDKREALRAILRENGLQARQTLFVGDMEHDVEAARLGGVLSCAVLTGYNTLGQLRSARPDLIVEHLGKLRERLERGGRALRSSALNGRRTVRASGLVSRVPPVALAGRGRTTRIARKCLPRDPSGNIAARSNSPGRTRPRAATDRNGQ